MRAVLRTDRILTSAPILEKDLSHMPETLILTAEFDPLRDEGEAVW